MLLCVERKGYSVISIIIPVYNAGPYLARCLDSVLNSTYHDFELILINDGSTDSSFEICTEYAQRDSRIKLISQENQGVSAARNRGLEECCGEWVVFVDADDILSPDFLGWVSRTENQSSDLLLFDFGKTAEELCASRDMPEAHFYNRENLTEILRCVLVPQHLAEMKNVNPVSPCAKAYKKSIVDQYALQFDREIFNGEDRLFNLEYLLKIKSCVHFSLPVYFYNKHSDSSFHRFSPELLRNSVRLLERIRGVLENNSMFVPLKKEYYSYAIENLTCILIWEVFSPYNSQTYREKRASFRKLADNALYQEALPYNRTCGRLARRTLVFFFRLKWYHAVSAICVLSNRYLGRKRLC